MGESEITVTQNEAAPLALRTAIIPALLAFFAALLAFIPYVGDARELLLRDPDNYLRLVQIRDWLGGQSWWDVTQYRMGPPEGIRMHWSRLADLPVGLAIMALSPFLGPQQAEIWAVVAVPPLLLLCLLVLLSLAARSLGGTVAGVAAPILTLTVAMVLAAFVPGRIDHHGLQLLLLTGGIATAFAGERARNGALLALCMALSMCVGLETLPMFAVIAAWLVGRWILDGEPAAPKLRGFAIALGISLPLLHFASTDPAFWLQATGDQVGRGHLALALLASLVLGLGMPRFDRTPGQRIALAALAAAGAVCVVIAFRELVSAPYADLDALANAVWMSRIAETSSVLDQWAGDRLGILTWFAFPFLSSLAAIWLVRFDDGTRRLALCLLLTIAGLILTSWQIRINAIASVPCIIVMACLLARFWERWKAGGQLLPLLIAILFANGTFGVIAALPFQSAEGGGKLVSRAPSTRCEEEIGRAGLDHFPPGLVLSSTTFGGIILVETRHSILSSSAHRNHIANSRAFRMWLAEPASAQALMRAGEVDYVLYCSDAEFAVFEDMEAASLAARVMKGDALDYLEPLQRSDDGSFAFYRVRR